MRYLIGALFGVCLVLLFLGGTIYYQYYQSERQQEAAKESSELKQRASSGPNKNIRPPSAGSRTQANHYSSKQSRIKKQGTPVPSKPISSKLVSSKPVSSQSESNLYTWKDKDGNKVISSQPPATGHYKKFVLPEEGLSVVEMKKAKPIKRKTTRRKRQYASTSSSPALIKQQLISKNKGGCRWLVGRSFELYTQIQQHSGANRSISCDEHIKRKREMRQLAREGNACYYPYSTPSKC